MTGGRFGLVLPALTLTLVSAGSMALEIVAGRALAPFVGMSLYSWTVIIAVVLAGLSAGHWVGGVLADRARDPRRAVALTLAGAGATAFVSLGLLRVIEPFVAATDPITHVSALALVFLTPSLLAGVISPLLTRMAMDARDDARRGRVLGMMFALGAFGAIIGTLVSGLALIAWVGVSGSVALIAVLYVALSLPYWRGAGRLGVGALAGLAAIGGAQAPEALGLKTPCLTQSVYFCIRVDDLTMAGRAARVMALDHLAHGVNDALDPRLLLTPYVQGVDELVAQRFPGPAISAFFVGGGAYSLPRAWAARYPDGRFMVAELDPEVTRIAREKMWFTPDARTEIRHGDGRFILESLPADRRFDVIFGDAFKDISIPQHLATDEFHAEIARRLNPGGVYALNVVDSLRTPRFVLSLGQTLKKRFRHVELWLDVEAVRPGDRRTTWIVLASDRPSPSGALQSEYGFLREWALAPLDRMIASVGDIGLVTLTDDYAPVDRLLSGVLLTADLAEGGG